MNAVQRIVNEAEKHISEIYLQPVKLIIIPLKGTTSDKDALNFLTAIASRAIDIPIQDFFVKTRRRDIAHARMFVSYYAKNEYKIGPSEVSRFFGLKTHSNMCYGYKKIKDLLDAKDRITVLHKNLIEEELRQHYQIKVKSDIKN